MGKSEAQSSCHVVARSTSMLVLEGVRLRVRVLGSQGVGLIQFIIEGASSLGARFPKGPRQSPQPPRAPARAWLFCLLFLFTMG